MTQKQCFVIWRCDRIHMLPGSFLLSMSIQKVWLHWMNGLLEYGVRPGVKYRHDLIEWNTICLVWHPASVLRTIFLGMMTATNTRSPFEFWQGSSIVLYMGQFIWKRTVRKKKLPAILRVTSNHERQCQNQPLHTLLGPQQHWAPLLAPFLLQVRSTCQDVDYYSQATPREAYHRLLISHCSLINSCFKSNSLMFCSITALAKYSKLAK